MPFISSTFASNPKKVDYELTDTIDLIRADLDLIEAASDVDSDLNDDMFDALDDFDDIAESLMEEFTDSMDGYDFSVTKEQCGDLCSEMTIEFTVADKKEGMVKIDKHSLQLFMLIFTPVMLAVFGYESIQLWKQSKRNRQMQYVKLPSDDSDSKMDYAEEMNNVKKPIALHACIWAVSFFWFAAMMVSCGLLLQ
jgi:hypothetical protein